MVRRQDQMTATVMIWAMSYSVIGGIISANTALVLEVSPLRKGRVDGEYSGTDFRKFYYAMTFYHYYAMTFYQKPDFCLNIMQRASNMSRRIIDCNPLEQRAS